MCNAISEQSIPTVIGTPFEGGFFAGLYKQGDETRALIVAGKDGDIANSEWGEYGQDILGACSYTDGLVNTQAMAAAGSELAAQVLALKINGHADWGIPARDQLELIYRHFKPTAQVNSCTFRDGDNPSSLPAGYPYTEQSPVKTSVEGFREGEEHALLPVWYWASTQFSSSSAWLQNFLDGDTYGLNKDDEARVRAVRSVVVTN